MTWRKTDFLLKKRLNQHGLGVLVEAGAVCREAERLYPGLFEALSVKNTVLHLKMSKVSQAKFLLIQGRLLHQLQTYCAAKDLPLITRFRLTICTE